MSQTQFPTGKSFVDQVVDLGYDLLKLWPVVAVASVVMFGGLWLQLAAEDRASRTQRSADYQKSAAVVGEAQSRQHLDRQATFATNDLNARLLELGWIVSHRVRTGESLIVTAQAPSLMSELEATEIALTIKQGYVSHCPAGTMVHVYVKSPAGQDLAVVRPGIFD